MASGCTRLSPLLSVAPSVDMAYGLGVRSELAGGSKEFLRSSGPSPTALLEAEDAIWRCLVPWTNLVCEQLARPAPVTGSAPSHPASLSGAGQAGPRPGASAPAISTPVGLPPRSGRGALRPGLPT